MNQWTIEVNEEDFDTAVLERSKTDPVLVDFWAPWCGPCRVLGPLLERLAEEYAGQFVLAKVNVDENPGLAGDFGVQGIPAVKLFQDGEIAGEFTGALPEAALREMLSRFLPSPADNLAEEAANLEQGGETAAAKARYQSVLEDAPNHPAALLGLGRLAFADGDSQRAMEYLDRVPLTAKQRKEAERLIARLTLQGEGDQDESALRQELDKDPKNLEARFKLAQALAGKEKYDEALPEFLNVIQTDRSFRDDGARKAMVQIFEILGSDHPLTERFRSELAKVLFR